MPTKSACESVNLNGPRSYTILANRQVARWFTSLFECIGTLAVQLTLYILNIHGICRATNSFDRIHNERLAQSLHVLREYWSTNFTSSRMFTNIHVATLPIGCGPRMYVEPTEVRRPFQTNRSRREWLGFDGLRASHHKTPDPWPRNNQKMSARD